MKTSKATLRAALAEAIADVHADHCSGDDHFASCRKYRGLGGRGVVVPRPIAPVGVDIELGTVFTWGDRPVLKLKGSNVTIHDGHVVSSRRPRRWWDLRSWVRVCRELWRMPYRRSGLDIRDNVFTTIDASPAVMRGNWISPVR